MRSRSSLPRVRTFIGAVLVGATVACGGVAGAPPPGQAQNVALPHRLAIPALGVTVRYPDGWSVPPQRFANMHEIINVTAAEQGVVAATASVKITSEARTSHAEAVRRLREIAAESPARPLFSAIGGWPALQRRYLDERSQPSQGPMFADRKVWRITTAVAADRLLLRLQASLPSSAAPEFLAQVEAIGRSLVFASVGDPALVQQETETLRSAGP